MIDKKYSEEFSIEEAVSAYKSWILAILFIWGFTIVSQDSNRIQDISRLQNNQKNLLAVLETIRSIDNSDLYFSSWVKAFNANYKNLSSQLVDFSNFEIDIKSYITIIGTISRYRNIQADLLDYIYNNNGEYFSWDDFNDLKSKIIDSEFSIRTLNEVFNDLYNYSSSQFLKELFIFIYSAIGSFSLIYIANPPNLNNAKTQKIES